MKGRSPGAGHSVQRRSAGSAVPRTRIECIAAEHRSRRVPPCASSNISAQRRRFGRTCRPTSTSKTEEIVLHCELELDPEIDRGAQAAMLDTAHSSRYIMRSFRGAHPSCVKPLYPRAPEAGATFPQRWRGKNFHRPSRENRRCSRSSIDASVSAVSHEFHSSGV
jgi:hypothetical protein